MKLMGKTKVQIIEEQQAKKIKDDLESTQKELDAELNDILRNMAIEKYIEKQKSK